MRTVTCHPHAKMKKKMQEDIPSVSGLIDNDSLESSSMESDSDSEQAVSTKKLAVSKKKAPGGGQNSFVSWASALGPQTTAGSEQQLQDGSLAGDVQVLILQEGSARGYTWWRNRW